MDESPSAPPAGRAHRPDTSPTAPSSGAHRRYQDNPMPGWDRYEIVGLLGEGAMGRVYRAVDLKLQRPVALKFLRSDDPSLAEAAWRRDHGGGSAPSLAAAGAALDRADTLSPGSAAVAEARRDLERLRGGGEGV